jgi:hypothetical protein
MTNATLSIMTWRDQDGLDHTTNEHAGRLRADYPARHRDSRTKIIRGSLRRPRHAR